MPTRRTAGPLRDEILRGIARTLFVLAWADRQDELRERGRKHVSLRGAYPEDLAPRSTPAKAKAEARRIAAGVRRLNGRTLTALWTIAANNDNANDTEVFGRSIAMSALGRGPRPALSYHEPRMKVPHSDFGPHLLWK